MKIIKQGDNLSQLRFELICPACNTEFECRGFDCKAYYHYPSMNYFKRGQPWESSNNMLRNLFNFSFECPSCHIECVVNIRHGISDSDEQESFDKRQV